MFEVALVDGVETQIPAAVVAEVASVDDLDMSLLAICPSFCKEVGWSLVALPDLEFVAGKVLHRCVIHEFYLMVEISGPQRVHSVEKLDSCPYSDLFLFRHSLVDLVEAAIVDLCFVGKLCYFR